MHSSLNAFHPITARWFAETFDQPTRAQTLGWQAVRDRRHTLIAAPTGSGKTLAAFLTALDDLVQEGMHAPLPDQTRIVYVSPLKALSADVHKNLAVPRAGMERIAEAMQLPAPRITVGVRTGDTTPSERAAMLRTPPHILVTTPESLYLLLTAERSREMLRSVRTVIIDEIHAVIATRRGAHLAISLERLEGLIDSPVMRIGLSATQKPIEEVARFLVGTGAAAARPLAIIDEGHRRTLDLALEIPRSPLEAVMSSEVWEECYDRLAGLAAEHRTTLVFVNTRRMAERVARRLSDRLGENAVTAHHGSLSKEKRLDAEARLKSGQLRALVATASLELGIDIGAIDLVCQIGSPHRIATFLQRVGRSGHTIGATPKGRLFPVSRDDLIECVALLRSVGRGELDAIGSQDAPLDVLAQQVVAETACRDCGEDDLFALVRRAWPYRSLSRGDFDAVVAMVAEGFATRRGRRAALVHRDEVNHRLRGRKGSRLLALSSGGAIPEVADYRVVVEPDDTFIGTVNEDFAIESLAGDIFQLGNMSWRILQVAAGVVRVADAKGAPPTIPFWLGEAPARSDELSRAVSDLRADAEVRLRADAAEDSGEPGGPARTIEWLTAETGISQDAAGQAIAYLADAWRALGVLPTQDTLVLERFFDESGGMQLVLHAPFGSRVNKAWGLALRKRFCRQFNFELQAAATEDALILSLGPQHSFPLSDVFKYLHSATARDILIQALLDAPVFQARWRWNTTVALAVPRNRGAKKVPAPLQRMLADDLMAAAFPDAAACLENIAGDRTIPAHPLVSQTLRDCLEDAMDYPALASVLDRIHRGAVRCVARDTPEPSPLTHEILNARPYAFLDDAPLEERRTQAVYARRATHPRSSADHGALDADAIDRVRHEQRPDPGDADELHDALLTAGFLTRDEAPGLLVRALAESGRAAWTQVGVVAAERLPEWQAIHPKLSLDPAIEPPERRAARAWTRETALVEIVRGRLTIAGPTTALALASAIEVGEADIDAALLALESEGTAMRGRFTASGDSEWCDRTLLARIHRYTLNRLRAEIEPVTVADYMRFLFAWQHVDPSSRLAGLEGLRAVIDQLHGIEVAADAWERSVLPARVDHYEPSMLDMLCLAGEVGWTRRPASADAPTALTGATPIALFSKATPALPATPPDGETSALPASAASVLAHLRTSGASFAHEIAAACQTTEGDVKSALSRLVAAGLVSSDGFGGLRSLVSATATGRPHHTRSLVAGRWFALRSVRTANESDLAAQQLLRRYGIVCRRVLARERELPPWRELVPVFRRLEARGDIRGGRFVNGLAGEQFAAPDAVERLREIRRMPRTGQLATISAADPLNLCGLVTAGERVRTMAATRIVFRDGEPVVALEGDYLRPLSAIAAHEASRIASAAAGRTVPAITSGFVGR